MPAGPKLTEEEQAMILALTAVGKGHREIERLLSRSRSAIAHFLRDPAGYNINKRSGRPPKVSAQDLRRLLRTASNSFLSSRELVDECQLAIKARRARQLLNQAKHLHAKGTSTLAILEGNQDSGAYAYTLSDHLFPYIDYHFRRECIFQHDNASIHASKETKEFLNEHNVHVMDWPAKSPDLNPIENIWGVLARAVYAHGRQFASKNELIAAILKAWDGIGQDLIDKLLKSMQKRCVSVLELKGSKTKY
ncbi:hypothetical protein H257_07640 [Aphanomyces astaci]|uniref:Tc1-like transposase DDE domain-containing protein n=1 Tax=Aphanomyces astaci TaxID=112090 RepID=W4GGJ8_APHAT|nr:hypothetical protein H257_07640 [Aphanomyces astaci]ETV78810.1 hypothetical protein H257_07640 [Aphanomyces astaci]|eukprot:XP_009831529.1 hypothetical protein H257_07640 [Aphanomyces astaci]